MIPGYGQQDAGKKLVGSTTGPTAAGWNLTFDRPKVRVASEHELQAG
ncbi:MAG: hypothetical protein ACI97B_000481 [Verrucomicrobiales bacterium]|jgi:hypothetical protein